jgi:hypothetical protein
MAVKPKARRGRPPKKAPEPPVEAAKEDDAPKLQEVAGLNSADFVTMVDRRVNEATQHWNSKPYNLAEKTKENESVYLGTNVADSDTDDDIKALDNRVFSAIRTVVPFVTSRITEPDVLPSSSQQKAIKFAEDLEKALYTHAKREKVNQKVKFALEDAIVRYRGYLKPRYDPVTKNFFSLEYIPCESIIVDHKAKAYEEPGFFRHVLDKTVEDLLTMFPGAKDNIYKAFKLPENPTSEQLQMSREVHEDWTFIQKDGAIDLVVGWSYNKVPFGVIQDPNWRYDDTNFTSSHMMPLIPINVLNDGRSLIDKTSFVEQAKYSQHTINKRSEQISKNTDLGTIGMPVVDSASISDEDAEYLRYEPDTAIILDTGDTGKGLNDVFTTWKAGSLSPDVYKDKVDAVEAVENAFGASSIQQGNQSNNNTLGQDQLLRDQSQGRQQEAIDAVDAATSRIYLLMAQFLLVYGDEEELFRFVGENAQFDYLIMHSEDIDTEAMIGVKSGTSMPIDKVQRRATADKSASQGMIDPLSYWEIMDEANAQKYAKRLMEYTTDPASFLKDAKEEVFNRDAYVDIEIIKHGGQPEYRDDLPTEYFDHLNKYVLSGDLENPALGPDKAQAISQFIDQQLARAQKMLGAAETQLPTAEDVNAYNESVDKETAAAGGGQTPPGAKPQPAPVA